MKNSHWCGNLSFRQLDGMHNGKEKAIQFAIYGLGIDGGRHKQWHLEQILIALGVNLALLREEMERDDYSWDEGIAP